MSSLSIQSKEIVPSYDNDYDNSYNNGYNNDYNNDYDNDCGNDYDNNTTWGLTTTLYHHLESAHQAQYVKTEKYCKKIKKVQDEC
ncbi:31991_t:CDS:2, partial [Racocetra persica]